MLIGYEWLIIGGIVLAIFLFGPSKIPALARALGQAKKEFDDTKKGVEVIGIRREEDKP